MADVKEAIRRLIYQYSVEGAEKVLATQEAVAASTTATDKASLSLDKSFSNLERRYVDTVRAQQDYQKVQEKVNAAVAQNPALQERANVVLAAAGQHFDNLASRAEKGSITTKLLGGAIRTLIGPAGLLGLAMTGVGTAIGYMAAQWQSSKTTVEQALTETNRLIAEGKKLIDERTSAQDRMFAQSKDQTQFELLQNQVDLQRKLNAEIEQTIALAEKRAGMPSQVPGEMGEAPTGFAPSQAPGYKQIAEAMEQLRNAQAAGLPGMRDFNAELGRIGQEYPQVASTVQELIKAGQTATGLEQAALKARAISDALGGVATNAQMAAVGLGSIAQFNFDNLRALDAAYAMERMVNAMDDLAAKYPTLSIEGAKQVELLQSQLEIAKARTDEERLLATQRARVLQLTLEGRVEEEATLIAALERRIAEENIKKIKEQQAEAAAAAAEREAEAADARAAANDNLARQREAQKEVADEVEDTNSQLAQSGSLINQAARNLEGWLIVIDEFEARWVSLRDMIRSNLNTANRAPGVESSYDPLWTQLQKQAMIASGYDESDLEQTKGPFGAPVGYWLPKTDSPGLVAATALGKSLEDLTSSTDALNATMQAALSPYYSQDPRTTKLGFRAGVVGNQDWLAPGASNANPLAAILGQNATAPGMANGGSFIVGGGYSANDNKIAAFPVASGEQVVVNRGGEGAGGAKVINIDNRIIVNGSVDADTMSQMKISRYQQSQRMRAGLASA